MNNFCCGSKYTETKINLNRPFIAAGGKGTTLEKPRNDQLAAEKLADPDFVGGRVFFSAFTFHFQRLKWCVFFLTAPKIFRLKIKSCSPHGRPFYFVITLSKLACKTNFPLNLKYPFLYYLASMGYHFSLPMVLCAPL